MAQSLAYILGLVKWNRSIMLLEANLFVYKYFQRWEGIFPIPVSLLMQWLGGTQHLQASVDFSYTVSCHLYHHIGCASFSCMRRGQKHRIGWLVFVYLSMFCHLIWLYNSEREIIWFMEGVKGTSHDLF